MPETDSDHTARAADAGKRRSAYAIVTPVRDEAENLRRIAGCLDEQTLRPTVWIIVDTGSTDGTLAEARALAGARPWIVVRELAIGSKVMRGGPIVKAFHDGLHAVPEACELVVKLDADITFEPDHFDRLVAAFESDARLGIGGGIAYERDADGVWRQRHGTGPGVWGADRMYRRACLDDILPLDERMGWDTIDLVSANVHGWETRGLDDLPFLHHRAEGQREITRFEFFRKQGDAAHYMGYRPSYLVVRTLFRSTRDPWAFGIILGYLDAAKRREPRHPNASVRDYVRDQQRARRLKERAREALRHRAALEDVGT
jgi:glycosyltransferase involved in cell wall biosynthesis